ncbi:MAG TPA: hypothetical protein VG406_26130 [Isosphaeraceae bacterium]|nr:hypothetical protein [Isosphaeraceae bacterium]
MPRVVHFEIHAEDFGRAEAFYKRLFGWEFTRWDGPLEFWMIRTGPSDRPGIDGGMVRRPVPVENQQAVIGYVCTVDVDSVDDTLAAALDAGGALALPKMAVPGVGWLAYAKDTEGNVFGMMQADPAAK